MMPIFRVLVTGKNLEMIVDGDNVLCGFYKNEYIRAPDSQLAASMAKERVQQALIRKAAVGVVNTDCILIRVDSIESTLRIWKLLLAEGFVFFHENDSDSDDTSEPSSDSTADIE